jgi:predicted TIM-barrel enzyme
MGKRFYGLFGTGKAVIGLVQLAGNDWQEKVSRALDEIMIYQEEGLNGALIRDLHGDVSDIRNLLKVLSRYPVEINMGINIGLYPHQSFELVERYKVKFIQISSAPNYATNPKRDVFVLGSLEMKSFIPDWKHLTKEVNFAGANYDAIVAIGNGMEEREYIKRLAKFRSSLNGSRLPLVSDFGANCENVMEQLDISRGVIVGSYFRDGNTMNSVNRDKVKKLMELVHG